MKEKCRKRERTYKHIYIYVIKRPDLVWRIKEDFPGRVAFGCSYETEEHL